MRLRSGSFARTPATPATAWPFLSSGLIIIGSAQRHHRTWRYSHSHFVILIATDPFRVNGQLELSICVGLVQQITASDWSPIRILSKVDPCDTEARGGYGLQGVRGCAVGRKALQEENHARKEMRHVLAPSVSSGMMDSPPVGPT